MYKYHPDRILRSLQPAVFQQLKSIEVTGRLVRSLLTGTRGFIPVLIPLLFVRSYHDRNFNIEVKFEDVHAEKSLELLDTVLKITEYWRRSVHLHVLFPLERTDTSRTQWPSVHTLDCNHSAVDFLFWIIPKCPQVVTLFLKNCSLSPEGLSCLALIGSKGKLRKLSTLDISNNGDVGGNLEQLLCSSFLALDTLLLNSCGLGSCGLSSLARASANGRLPKLSTLDISNNPHIGGNLSVLFSSASFPLLHNLFLISCELNKLDVSSLAEARERALLPKLTNLDVSFNFNPQSSSDAKSNSSSEVLCILSRLNTLVARGCWLEYNHLYHIHQRAITDCDYFSKLTTLDMTLNPGIEGYLSELVCHYFRNLSILVLRRCGLNSYDLSSLSQASSQGRLPELRHLDISQNNIGGEKKGLFRLFGSFKSFPSLINLIICDCHL